MLKVAAMKKLVLATMLAIALASSGVVVLTFPMQPAFACASPNC
jgi:hypothetical protein